MWLTWLEAICYCPCRVIPLLQMHSCGKIDIHLHGLIFFLLLPAAALLALQTGQLQANVKTILCFMSFIFTCGGLTGKRHLLSWLDEPLDEATIFQFQLNKPGNCSILP